MARFSQEDGCKYTLAHCAYIGDDILDLQCMELIKEVGGFAGCPADAAEEVKEIADYIAAVDGGKGAVRDMIKYILSSRGQWSAAIKSCYMIKN